MEHPVEEWESLKNIPIPEIESCIRFTGTKAVVTGYDDVKLELRKSSGGIKFEYHGHADDICKKGKRQTGWIYINEMLSKRDAFRLAKWIVGLPYNTKYNTDDEE